MDRGLGVASRQEVDAGFCYPFRHETVVDLFLDDIARVTLNRDGRWYWPHRITGRWGLSVTFMLDAVELGAVACR